MKSNSAGHPRQRLVHPGRRAGDQNRVVRRRIGKLLRPARRSSRPRTRRRACRRTSPDNRRTARRGRRAGGRFRGWRASCPRALPPSEAFGQCSGAMPDWLQGRHALITGGGTGIGAAAATHLNAAGAKVTVLGRRAEPLELIRKHRRRHRGPGRRHRPRADRARVRRGPRRQRADRDAGGQRRDRRQRAVRQDDAAKAGTGSSPPTSPRRSTARRRRSGPAGERDGRLVFVASVASLRGVPYAAPLCGVEAWPARPDAQPRGRIRQDQPHRQRGLPGLCRNADDRPIDRPRVARHRAAAKTDPRSAIDQHECERAAGPSGRDRDDDHDLCACRSRRDINGAAITIDGGTSA